MLPAGLWSLLARQSLQLRPHPSTLLSRQLGERKNRSSQIVVLGEQKRQRNIKRLGQLCRLGHIGLIDLLLVAIDPDRATVLITTLIHEPSQRALRQAPQIASLFQALGKGGSYDFGQGHKQATVIEPRRA